MQKVSLQTYPARQFKNGQWHTIEDTVALESSAKLTWSAPDIPEQHMHVWGFPHHLAELGAGHVLLELLPPPLLTQNQTLSTRTLTAHVDQTAIPPVISITLSLPKETQPPAPLPCNAEQITHAMQQFMGLEGLWDTTGCFHRTAVYCPKQHTMLHVAEDIARHNCIDRLAGWAALNAVSLSDKILLASARITRTLCIKALRAGFRFLVSRSAVSSASITLAQQENATLVGFARPEQNRFTVFTDPRNLIC